MWQMTTGLDNTELDEYSCIEFWKQMNRMNEWMVEKQNL